MGIECDYSFEMLYKAAFGKELPPVEKLHLQKKPQKDINLLVKKWAKKAGWTTVERLGSDGSIYLAFHP